MAMAASLGAGPTANAMVIFYVVEGVFYMAQWEEYHTGTLNWSNGFVGVTESQFLQMGLFLGAAVFGACFVAEKTGKWNVNTCTGKKKRNAKRHTAHIYFIPQWATRWVTRDCIDHVATGGAMAVPLGIVFSFLFVLRRQYERQN